jgi:uncharacterized protein (UPF0335 family)
MTRTTKTTVASGELVQFIERIERLEEEKNNTSIDIKAVYAELKARGFDAKAVQTIVKIRKDGLDAHKEMQAIIDMYMAALKMA